MTDIFVEYVSEVYVKVLCEDHIMEELSQFFTFYSPGYQWSPAYKAKKWDGKIRLYHKITRQLYAGLIRYLITFATERNYTINVEPRIGLLNAFSIEETTELVKRLDVWSQGKPLTPRDYQLVGIAKAIRYKRMLMLSPTASGKSYMIYVIMRHLLEKECKKGLIIVPTTSLVEQMKSDFDDYAHDTWDVSGNVHRIYSGYERHNDKPLTISTWQSLNEIKDNSFFTKFDFVFGDEAHGFKAESLKKMMCKMVNAKYRIGTTGTLDSWKVHKLVIEGLFGPNSKLTTTKRMIDEKQAAELSIKCLILKHPKEICHIVSKWSIEAYQKEISYLIGSEPRNKFVGNLAVSLKGNSLLLFQRVEAHGEKLFQLINSKVAKNRKVFYIHGATETEEREAVREIVEKETDAIIVASYGVFSTGVNIRNLHNIIFASPSKSKVRVLQSIGRGLRLSESKSTMTLYDIADDLRIDDFINFTLKHFAARVKIYKSEEFKISNYSIELK